MWRTMSRVRLDEGFLAFWRKDKVICGLIFNISNIVIVSKRIRDSSPCGYFFTWSLNFAFFQFIFFNSFFNLRCSDSWFIEFYHSNKSNQFNHSNCSHCYSWCFGLFSNDWNIARDLRINSKNSICEQSNIH